MAHPKIVLVVTDYEKNAQIKPLDADLLELRVDLFKSISVDYAVRQFQNRRALKLPLILTVRNQKKEGAQSARISDAHKWSLLEALMPMAQWVDIEFSSPLCKDTVALARSTKTSVIVSAHDFNGMPANLNNIFKKALSTRADMVKIAARAKSDDDFVRMIDFTHLHHRPRNGHAVLTTMCVGEYGALSRLALPAAGSAWVYTFCNRPTAPGQVDIKTLKATQAVFTPRV